MACYMYKRKRGGEMETKGEREGGGETERQRQNERERTCTVNSVDKTVMALKWDID